MKPRFSLRELIVVLVVMAVLGAIGVQTHAASRWEARRMACASNLRALHQSRFTCDVRHHAPTGRPCPELGSEFFLVLQRAPAIVGWHEPFFCPLSGDAIQPNRTSYRGPARLDNTGNFPDPISADKEGNHGPGKGGNILTQSGDVLEVSASDQSWIRARTTTRD